MFSEIILFVKHPYAAGVIAVQWIASTILFALDRDLPIIRIVMFNMATSFIVAMFGFRSKR
ncbi:TPA: hypothetical protein EYO12_03000 [Candidatus Saccharibacteria bacterium]|nr:hypothetical protein [Candidatus Saccharibacteria bacterium]HIO87997.1 hypothetical protein [Candidatus Saccharibacteria bacterium]